MATVAIFICVSFCLIDEMSTTSGRTLLSENNPYPSSNNMDTSITRSSSIRSYQTSSFHTAPGASYQSSIPPVPPNTIDSNISIANSSSSSSSSSGPNCLICAEKLIRSSTNGSICVNMTCNHGILFHKECLLRWINIR